MHHCNLLSLTHSGSLWFTLALSLTHSRTFWLTLALSLALSSAHRLTSSLLGSPCCGPWPQFILACRKPFRLFVSDNLNFLLENDVTWVKWKWRQQNYQEAKRVKTFGQKYNFFQSKFQLASTPRMCSTWWSGFMAILRSSPSELISW